MDREFCHQVYDTVIAQLQAGDPVSLDIVAKLSEAGYVFPDFGGGDEYVDDDDVTADGPSANIQVLEFADSGVRVGAVSVDDAIAVYFNDMSEAVYLSLDGAAQLAENIDKLLEA